MQLKTAGAEKPHGESVLNSRYVEIMWISQCSWTNYIATTWFKSQQIPENKPTGRFKCPKMTTVTVQALQKCGESHGKERLSQYNYF